jgi:hypothetical protein
MKNIKDAWTTTKDFWGYTGSCGDYSFVIDGSRRGGIHIGYQKNPTAFAVVSVSVDGRVETSGEYNDIMKIVEKLGDVEKYMKKLQVKKAEKLFPILMNRISDPDFGTDAPPDRDEIPEYYESL